MRGAFAAAALGLTLGLGGGLFDAEPLFVGGIAFALLGALAWAWVGLAARGARVERQLGARRVVEGEPVAVRVRADAPVPLPGGELVEPLLPAPAPLRAGRRRTRVRVEVRFDRRGRRRLEPPAIVVHDPLRLASREIRAAGAPDELLVLPRVEPVAVPAGAEPSASGRALGALAGIAEVEVDGLRAYRPGTPASRIHWPALARGAGLLERRLRPDGDGRPLVVLDSRGGEAGDLDAAVRAAASLTRALAAAAGCGLLLPGERRAARIERDLAAWPSAWARLALVQAGAAPPPLAGLATRIGPVFYVAAAPPPRVPRALRHAPGDRILVVPGEAPGTRVLTVAGCTGYALVRRGARGGRVAA